MDELNRNKMVIMDRAKRGDLKSLILEELWRLFPVELTPYRPQWAVWADDEMAVLKVLLSDFSPVIHHIGSTAIPGIYAKPIVDILVEIPSDADWTRVRELMEQAGYICMSSAALRMSFNKGYTPEGFSEKVFHVHFHAFGDCDEVCFRDWLKGHPREAHDYESLKLSLLPEYKYNRDAYTEAKSEYIKRVTALAKRAAREDNA